MCQELIHVLSPQAAYVRKDGGQLRATPSLVKQPHATFALAEPRDRRNVQQPLRSKPRVIHAPMQGRCCALHHVVSKGHGFKGRGRRSASVVVEEGRPSTRTAVPKMEQGLCS